MPIWMARENDAEELLRLLHRLDHETRFMMCEPRERTTTVEAQREFLRDILATGNSVVLLAEVDGRSVGFLEATGGAFRRDRHVAHLVVGVLKEYAGRGVGSTLLAEAERWARKVGLRRLELTAMAHNRAAVALYEKAGFVEEGTRKTRCSSTTRMWTSTSWPGCSTDAPSVR